MARSEIFRPSKQQQQLKQVKQKQQQQQNPINKHTIKTVTMMCSTPRTAATTPVGDKSVQFDNTITIRRYERILIDNPNHSYGDTFSCLSIGWRYHEQEESTESSNYCCFYSSQDFDDDDEDVSSICSSNTCETSISSSFSSLYESSPHAAGDDDDDNKVCSPTRYSAPERMNILIGYGYTSFEIIRNQRIIKKLKQLKTEQRDEDSSSSRRRRTNKRFSIGGKKNNNNKQKRRTISGGDLFTGLLRCSLFTTKKVVS